MRERDNMTHWTKSSYSNGSMACVEWRKARASHGNGACLEFRSAMCGNGTCVELAETGDSVLVRDSKHPDAGHLTVPAGEFAALVAAARAGELDDLIG
jgi:hypothetical protein